MFNFVTCVENCQVYQLSPINKIESTDKNNCLYFGMILANTDNSCISWFVVNTYTTERARSSFFKGRTRMVINVMLLSLVSFKDSQMSWLQTTLNGLKLVPVAWNARSIFRTH